MVLRGALQGFSGKTLPSVYAYPFVRFYQYAETQIALETVVIEQSFGIPVVVLQAYILIAFFRQPECRFEEYVGIEVPPSAFGYHGRKRKTLVLCPEIPRHVPVSGVTRYVLVFLGFPERYPGFELNIEIAVDHVYGGKAHPVPAAVPYAVQPVRFVFYLKESYSEYAVVDDYVVAYSYGRIVVRVFKRSRFAVYIPERFLCIRDEKVHVVRQYAFYKAVHDTYLKLRVAVVLVDASVEIRTGNEIIVFVNAERRYGFQFPPYAVAQRIVAFFKPFVLVPCRIFFLVILLCVCGVTQYDAQYGYQGVSHMLLTK